MNREILERQFEENQLKHKIGTFGNTVSYIEGGAVVARLNEAFDGSWSFDVVEYKILDEEIIVLGKLTAEGIGKSQFGNSKITRNRDSGETVSLGDDLKSAATDSLKKCATLFGVGLYLYNGVDNGNGSKPKPENNSGNGGNGHGKGNGGDKAKVPNGDGRLTNKQLGAIFGIGKARKMSQKEIKDFSVRMFDRVPEYLNKEQASTIIKELQAIQ